METISYKYDENLDGYVVSKAFGNSKSYNIKKEHKGKLVKGIGERAFYRHTRLETIIFEDKDNIDVIMKLAFSECPNLKNIDLSGVEEIKRNAFSYDYSLTNIELNTAHIGASAFYKCTSLYDVKLNDNLISIGSMAFSYTKIEEITLPDTTKVVYENAFKYCDNLNKIYIYNTELLVDSYLNELIDIIEIKE